MDYKNLKENDVVFCESKKSRVLKLVSQKSNGWLCEDIFTKQSHIINEKDNLRLVNTSRKVKPISLRKLFEEENSNDTLTEREVYIVEYIIDNYSLDTLKEIESAIEDGQILNVNYKNLNSFLRYLAINKEFAAGELSQYFLCALNNYGSEINQSTKIDRFIPYKISFVEISNQARYDYCGIEVYGPNTESYSKTIREYFIRNIGEYVSLLEYNDMDYGDTFGSKFNYEDLDSEPSDEFIL